MTSPGQDRVRKAAARFGPFEGRPWLNTAHQGPVPAPAVEAAAHAVDLKVAPLRRRAGDGDVDRAPAVLATPDGRP